MKIISSIILVTALFTGCKSSTTDTANKSYNAITHDGRIYVIGDSKTLENFKTNHHLPLTKTMIGAGPNGETVVVEVSKDDPTMANKLWIDYANDNIHYYERYHDGRVYVMGSLSSLENFKKTHHLPLTKTYIGEGSNGETVVIEESKDDKAHAASLWSMYKKKHKK